MSPARNKARVIETVPLSPSVQKIVVDVAGGRFEFRAGQWVHLHVATPSGVEKRAYSLASSPGSPHLEIAVTRVEDGVVSPILSALPVGAEFELDGPHGFFTREEPELRSAPALFVATGTGLAPLRSMLGEALARGGAPPFVLLFGCRNQPEILWREELETWASRERNFRFEVTLSRPDPAWRGRTGYVQRHVAELARTLEQPHVFICGLNRMVSEVRRLCKSELGWDRKRIHSERYD